MATRIHARLGAPLLLTLLAAACTGEDGAPPIDGEAPGERAAAAATPEAIAPEPIAPEPAAEPSVDERLEELERLRLADPAAAMGRLRMLRVTATGEGARPAIDERFARWLEDDYERAARAGDREAMAAAIEEILGAGLRDPRAEALLERWARDRSAQLEAAIAAQDTELADRLAAETLADPRAFFPGGYAAFEAERWKVAFRTARFDEADEILSRVAAALAKGAPIHPFDRTLAEEAPRERLERMADAWRAADRPDAEWLCLEGARLAETPPGRGSFPALRSDRLMLRIDLARRRLAERVVAGDDAYAGVTREHAEQICDAVYRNGDDILRDRRSSVRDQAAALDRALGCRRLQIESRIERAREQLADGHPTEARTALTNLLREEPTWLHALYTHDPAYDPWPDVPDEVRARIDAEHPGAGRDERLRALRSELERYRYSHPFAELAPARALVVDATAARGLELVARARVETGESSRQRSRDLGLDELRAVLREHPESDAARRTRDGLRAGIRQAATDDDVSALSDLAGFLVAEWPEGGRTDAFREELRGFLEATATRLAQEQPFVDIFLKSLLADLYAGEPTGERARAEVLDKGLAFVRARVPTPEDEPAGGPASGLDGLSTIAVDNGTRFHLLAFHEGPERFFVRLNPYRRATIVLADGDYETAVLATGADIRPYRARTSYRSEHREATYVIATERDGRPDAVESSTSGRGRYQLARAPEGAGPFTVDPRTGLASRDAP